MTKVRNAFILVVALLLAGYVLSKTTNAPRDEQPRKASIEIWWAPSGATGLVNWVIGARGASELETGPTQNAPFRRTGTVHRGVTVAAVVTFKTAVRSGRCIITVGKYKSQPFTLSPDGSLTCYVETAGVW